MKVVHTLLFPWKKYSEFFDNGCVGIWGLSPVLKYTFIFFALFFIPLLLGIVDLGSEDTSLYFNFMVMAFLAIAAVWFLYFPILAVITLYRAFFKAKVTVVQTINNLDNLGLQMTPKKLYLEPHINILIYLILAKERFLDFIDWLSQYYPISLLFEGQVRYPIKGIVRNNARYYDFKFATLNIPLQYVDVEINQYNVMYKFVFYEKVKSTDKIINKLEKEFKKVNIYIKENNEHIILIVPHEGS